jgi:predicted HicB family RNase H-like nuclease
MNTITWKDRRPRHEPKPVSTATIRMDPAMYQRVSNAAHESKVSLNTFCLTAVERLLKEVEGTNE